MSVIDRKPHDISVLEKEFLRRVAYLVVNLIESCLISSRLTTLMASLDNEAPRSESFVDHARLLQVLADHQ